ERRMKLRFELLAALVLGIRIEEKPFVLDLKALLLLQNSAFAQQDDLPSGEQFVADDGPLLQSNMSCGKRFRGHCHSLRSRRQNIKGYGRKFQLTGRAVSCTLQWP